MMRKLVFGLIAVAVAVAFISAPSAADATYVTAAKCKACHMKEYTVWAASKHANAWASLKPEEQKNPECVSCHVTGAGKPGGGTPELQNVQCEACHGPGSNYKSIDIMKKSAYAANKDEAHKKAVGAGLIIPTEDTCKTCHNAKSPHFKPPFDFAAAKEKIKHWQ